MKGTTCWRALAASVRGMDAPAAAPRAVRMVRPTWVWGGICLAASVVPALLWQATVMPGVSRVVGYVGELLWCAAFVLFAVGRDSVVARRALGTVTLLALAIWPALVPIVVPALPVFSAGTGDPLGAYLTGVVVGLIPVVLALIAVVQVWRSRVVPRAFRWAPAAALVLCVVPGVIASMPFLVPATQNGLSAVVSLMAVSRTVALIGLGVVAIVAGLQPRTVAPVRVFSSSGE